MRHTARTAALAALFLAAPAQAATATGGESLFQTLGLLPAAKPGGAPAQPTAAGTAAQTAGGTPAQAPTAALAPAAPGVVAASPGIAGPEPQQADYRANLQSDVFGANLFTGAFARTGAAHFNPDYAIAVGDNIQLRFWGAFELDTSLTVDPQGNLFVPHVGPLRVLGVHNSQLQALVESAVRRVYRANVYSYASLAAAQPARIYVGGFVARPGLYGGTSTDSLLNYLDQAGGIDPERGSFLDVQVKRGGQVRAHANLYDFLLDGRMPQIQLGDGDVIFVPGKHKSVQALGLAANAKRFEFKGEPSVADVIRLARPSAAATHVRVTRNTGTTVNIDYHPLADAARLRLAGGDSVEFTADKRPGTITVRIEGEHQGPQEYVVPYGTRLGSLLSGLRYTDRADKAGVKLYRQSVIQRQKAMLDTTLKHLETSVLTARSGTEDEAALRTAEANLMLQWIERAKAVVPTGQVLISQADHIGDLLLESGDVLKIPAADGLVLVSGEVMFPNTVAAARGKDIDDYIASAGGYTQNADKSRIVIAHRDGRFEDTEETGGWFSEPEVAPGDEILVLPAVDPKYRQLFKELAMMLYQMGLGARVFLK